MEIRPVTAGDRALYHVLEKRAKFPQPEAKYSEDEGKQGRKCGECKFFIELDHKCFITDGKIAEGGVCKYYTSWETNKEPYPGDLAWEFVKKTGEKLNWKEGHVILKGDDGWQCQDCKFYFHWGGCLIILGKFKPAMSCRYILKPGDGVSLVDRV